MRQDVSPERPLALEPMTTSVSQASLDLATALISMNTVSERSNLELIHHLRDRHATQGVKSRLSYNLEKTKANLFATIGEGKKSGVILSGHTDTVPWEGQAWTLDPLSGRVENRDGEARLYGRGSADMKGFIAMAMSNVDLFLRSDSPLSIHLAFTYDEEVGCMGVRELIADMKDAHVNPIACIVGEPTLMIPAIAHKGVYRYKCCVRGKAAHSSLTPTSVNAISSAARLVAKLDDMARDFERNEVRFEGFDVPFSTTSVGQFHGGIADNVVPEDAEFRYEFRNLPTADARRMQEEVVAFAREQEAAMKRIAVDAGFTFETICEVPAFLGSEADKVTRMAQRLSGENRTTMVAFGTEAGIFSQIGIPTVVCGPGDIRQAHQADEYVSLDQLARCEAFLRGLADVREVS
jgi:acetylornithine deacetylase